MKIIFQFSFLLLINQCFGQINFTNSGFEGPIPAGTPPFWSTCSYTPDTQPFFAAATYVLNAFEGNSYVGIQTDSSDFSIQSVFHESFSQAFSCYLFPNHEISFSLWTYNLRKDTIVGHIYKSGGVLEIFAGFNSCEMDTLIWRSQPLDSVWKKYDIVFTPTKPYTHITFQANNYNIYTGWNSKHSYIGIDALSKITVEGYNFFSFPNTDTTINKGNCVSFTASSDDTGAVIYWSTTSGDSVATGDSITVCPTNTTAYICTATLGCGQQFSDIVTVTVLGGGNGTPIMQIPNLLTAEAPVWKIINPTSAMPVTVYNTLGQLVYRKEDYQNNLAITTLAAATYFYEIKVGSNTYRGKFMVVR